MAHNNHFFFSQLVNLQNLYQPRSSTGVPPSTAAGEAWEEGAAETTQYEQQQQQQQQQGQEQEPIMVEPSESRIPPKLRAELERNFSSIETLRREFLTTAMGMFGPGFVWLVRNARSQELRILTTYLAGSPYTAAHWRRQGVDWNTSAGDRNTVNAFFDRSQAGAGYGGGGVFTPQAPGGTDVTPLLCLNTWEHVYLTDYGVAGKGEYVQQWWETIDWEKVEGIAMPDRRDLFK